jgi:hypothetical protein
MNEHEIDLSKLSDYEISMLIIKRNTCNYKAEQITELLNKIGESKELTSTTPSNENKQTQQLLGSTDFNQLPWKSYKTKEKAEPTEAAWIFSKTSGAEALLATIITNGGKAQLGIFEYQLQGSERQFIARKPIK